MNAMPVPIIAQPRKALYLVECRGRFYIWSSLSDHVYGVDRPCDLAGILEMLAISGNVSMFDLTKLKRRDRA